MLALTAAPISGSSSSAIVVLPFVYRLDVSVMLLSMSLTSSYTVKKVALHSPAGLDSLRAAPDSEAFDRRKGRRQVHPAFPSTIPFRTFSSLVFAEAPAHTARRLDTTGGCCCSQRGSTMKADNVRAATVIALLDDLDDVPIAVLDNKARSFCYTNAAFEALSQGDAAAGQGEGGDAAAEEFFSLVQSSPSSSMRKPSSVEWRGKRVRIAWEESVEGEPVPLHTDQTTSEWSSMHCKVRAPAAGRQQGGRDLRGDTLLPSQNERS